MTNIKKFLNSEVFPKFLYELIFGSVRASAKFVSHHCPYSVAISWAHRANRDCCWWQAPVTGVNKRESTLSEIVTVQLLILFWQHGLPAPLTVCAIKFVPRMLSMDCTCKNVHILPLAEHARKFAPRMLSMRSNRFPVYSACDKIVSAYAQHTHAIIFENDSKIPN